MPSERYYEDWLDKPIERMSRARSGPYTVTRSKDSVTVVSAAGRTVFISAQASNFHTEIGAELVAGIEVSIDGRLVGHLFQKHHGFLRRSRGLHFVPLDASLFPSSPFFRLRRLTKVVCENASGQLIGPPWFVPLPQTLNIAEGVNDALVLIYVAVDSGLSAVMQL